MKGCLVGLSKLTLGVFMALVLLSLAGVATARYFMAKLSVLPPRPVFSNEAAPPPAAPKTDPLAEVSENPAVLAAAEPTPAVPEKPEGSYEAAVTQPIGLVLRSGPGTEHQQLGGVDYNEMLFVLKASDDGQWLNIKLARNGQEGWIKAGNIRRTDGQ
jgi:uncharacterized protein YgiM (DUF1202 family)